MGKWEVGQFRTGSGTALFPNYYHFHLQNYAVPPGLAMGKQFEIRSTHVFLYVPLILFFCLLLCYRIKITQQVTSTGFLFPPFCFFLFSFWNNNLDQENGSSVFYTFNHKIELFILEPKQQIVVNSKMSVGRTVDEKWVEKYLLGKLG